MPRVAGFALRDDVPQTMELSMLAQKMVAAKARRVDVPDAHGATRRRDLAGGQSVEDLCDEGVDVYSAVSPTRVEFSCRTRCFDLIERASRA